MIAMTMLAAAAVASAPAHFLEVEGGTIAYDDVGPRDGQVVVCVPGMGDVRQEYRFLAAKLVERGYRVITIDAASARRFLLQLKTDLKRDLRQEEVLIVEREVDTL